MKIKVLEDSFRILIKMVKVLIFKVFLATIIKKKIKMMKIKMKVRKRKRKKSSLKVLK
jgi:hypothetical protein